MNPHADRITDLYERHAHDYVADRGRQLGNERTWLDRFTALLPQAASILDLGCGSAEPIARHLIEQDFAVDGVDTSPTLIALCRERFPDRCWHIADMRTLALSRNGFRVVDHVVEDPNCGGHTVWLIQAER
jgi:SAM-dependent methyltransferase